ncbi:hypothetical protein [Streptomyces sp. NPDC003247]|uniref:hypothetical protein n=1 Tax=Streptomyces sp. NPDC003247 TaxID=3364677 RepID=UPI0036BB10BF
MTDTRDTPDTDEPAEPTELTEAPEKPARRGRAAVVAGSVLLAGALLAGVGCTVVTVRGADRDAGAPVWTFPKTASVRTEAPTATGLAATLVPYGTDGWSQGPDLGEYGSDAQLGGAQATALQKEALSGLPRSQRKQLEQRIDEMHIQGMAMRSYLSGPPDPYTNDGLYTMSVVLSRMADQNAVRGIATFQNEFLAALDIFREGPQIKGHKDAKCFLPPEDDDEELDAMYCSAYVGDVLVTATATGVKPLDTARAATFLRTQLERIAEPGAAV